MNLITDRLRLRPVKPEDAAWIFPMMGDPEVMAFWDVGAIDDPEIIDAMVAHQIAETAARRAYYWAIERLSDDAPLGECDLSEIDRWHRRAEVGFILRREAWGEGLAAEAMAAVVNFAIDLGLKRLGARTHVANDASARLLRKLGFDEEGVLRGHVERDGERRDCRLFGLLL